MEALENSPASSSKTIGPIRPVIAASRRVEE
jgi:hypothetical protein